MKKKMAKNVMSTHGGNDNKILSELTPEHYQLMNKTKDYWMQRALRGGSNFTVEDIREDINWMYQAVGDMKTNKPHIFVFDSYATLQLGYNLLKLASEDNTGKLVKRKKHENITENPAMDRVWDLIWYGQHGQSIHEMLDSRTKREVQEKVWETVARASGDGVGMGVWDVVRQNLGKNITETTWANLWRMIAIPAAQSIRSKVTERIWNETLTQLAHYTSDEVNPNVTRQLESVLEDLISHSSKTLEFSDHFIGLGNWSGWIAFYDWYVQAGIIKENDGLPEEWTRFRRLMDKGIWTMGFFDNCALVCKLPKRVRRDPVSRQLHSLEGPAIEWQDGTGQYFIYGINFSESFVDNLGTPSHMWDMIAHGKMKWTDVFAVRNIEQRRVAMRVYGPEKIMKDAKAKLIDRSKRGNELWKIERQMAVRDASGKVTFRSDDGRSNTDENHTRIPEMRVMRYKDPSTDRVYHSFVPNNIDKADDGMSWKFQITPAQYAKLKVEG